MFCFHFQIQIFTYVTANSTLKGLFEYSFPEENYMYKNAKSRIKMNKIGFAVEGGYPF